MIAMSFKTFTIKVLAFIFINLLPIRDLVDTQQLIFHIHYTIGASDIQANILKILDFNPIFFCLYYV